ncbi:hypothetical protein QL285_002543 [Trifolium repens]|nr:hypothetical protein QL285_002543 [Trifolium repens]
MIHAMKFAHRNSWHNLWIESDSTAALRTFSNGTVVPWDLRNRWSNCLHPGLHIAISQIYHKGNCFGLGLELAQSILCSTHRAMSFSPPVFELPARIQYATSTPTCSY